MLSTTHIATRGTTISLVDPSNAQISVFKTKLMY